MLQVNPNLHDKNTSFGTRLARGPGIVEHLVHCPLSGCIEEIAKFRELLHKDGRNWTASLTLDKFVYNESNIRKCAVHPDPGVRFNAGVASKNIPNPARRNVIITSFDQSDDIFLKRGNAGSLGSLVVPETAMAHIRKYTNDPKADYDMQLLSASGAGKIDPKFRDDFIEELAASPYEMVRQGVISAVKDMVNPKRAIAVLEKLMLDDDSIIRQDAAKAIGSSIKNPRQAIACIKKHLTGTEAYYAARSAGDIADVKLAAAFIENKLVRYYNQEAVIKGGIDAAANLKDSRQAASLLEKFAYEPLLEMDIKTYAAGAAYQIKNHDIRNDLLEKFEKSTQSIVKRGANQAWDTIMRNNEWDAEKFDGTYRYTLAIKSNDGKVIGRKYFPDTGSKNLFEKLKRAYEKIVSTAPERDPFSIVDKVENLFINP